MDILDFEKKGISIQVVFAKHVSIFVFFLWNAWLSQIVQVFVGHLGGSSICTKRGLYY